MILRCWSRRRRSCCRSGQTGPNWSSRFTTMPVAVIYASLLLLCCAVKSTSANQPPAFTKDMNNLVLSETQPVGSIVYTLEGYDPEGSNVTFGLHGSHNFQADPHSGEVRLVQPLDRELQDTISFIVTIRDQVSGTGEDSTDDNIVDVPIRVIVSDENDNEPEFRNVPYETDVLEDAAVGTTVFDGILVTDRDTVGEILNISCSVAMAGMQELPEPATGGGCDKFSIELLESNQDKLLAAVVLRDKLDYNEKMIYHLQLTASDGVHTASTGLELRVKDVQNTPPVFQGSLASVIDEDSPIGTLVITFQAKDGDRGQPRKIVYDLLTNPMEYFLLDARTGELRTAKPLDKEALPDATGLITITVRARELVNGTAATDAASTTQTNASITIRDVNDSPPAFNKRNYFVTLAENTAPGTPLPLDMTVHDPDVGANAVFDLRLQDVSNVFEVEPRHVVGSSQVSIRVRNGTLDYENPNQRKFIVLVIAEETDTKERLSATATLTVSITDTNDNRPVFDEDTYSVEVSETASAGQVIATITARDLDSGRFGDQGLRYSLSGTGAELFHVDDRTGVLSVAECPARSASGAGTGLAADEQALRRRRDLLDTHGMYDDQPAYQVFSSAAAVEEADLAVAGMHLIGPGTAPCLDHETQSEYFLTYKATDDEGRGQGSVVSLRVVLVDANDSPPVCESSLYRATLDEGATVFDPPLQIRVRDPDSISDITYQINGNEVIGKLFAIDARTGQLAIRNTSTLDVTHLNSENVFFTVEANDGLFSTQCDVNITIRDVNNHAPHFGQERYVADVEESQPIGTIVQQIHATDLDSGVNADIRYRIQQGSFDDFAIDNSTGVVSISRKLDYDRRNTYQIEIVAADLGTPSLSGTASLIITVINNNDKDPYFTPATQRAEIAEDAPIGTLVHQLIALDPDVASAELLDYAATEPITAVNKDGQEIGGDSETFKHLFNVDRRGRVTVNAKLNRDLYAVIRISVLVTDTTAPVAQQGEGLLVITIIDVNEMPPEFSLPWTPTNTKLKFQFLEEQPIGSLLTTLTAHDRDSSIDSYQLAPNEYFEINNSTGVIRSTARIDYERIKEIPLTATVTDTGIPQLTATARLLVDIINVNDNRPQFGASSYEMRIAENSPRGAFVGRVQAHDADDDLFGELQYSLVGDDARHFHIDADSGNVTVLNATFLDREQRAEVSLTAVAQDKAPITTRKSDNVPVHIIIEDENDNAPRFTQPTYEANIAENVALNPPAAILKVVAFDEDADAFGSVKYRLVTANSAAPELFRLDADTGILYPQQSLQGLKGEYTLTAEARDIDGTGPNAATATIRIRIDSVNSYRPVFVMPALSNASIELQEHLVTADYLVMTVKATDNDTGDNGQLSYHLQVQTAVVQSTPEFSIDETSGELRVRHQLSRRDQSKYELVLVARDHGSPTPFETLRFLTITLVDQTENRPEFPATLNPYQFAVYENEPRSQLVGEVQATFRADRGGGGGGGGRSGEDSSTPVYYYMLLGNENWAFTLDRLTGALYTNRTLDREDVDSYQLYVRASRSPDLHVSDAERVAFSAKSLQRDASVAKIRVQVLDRNDNAPQFAETTVYAGVNARSGIDQLIAVLNVSDADEGVNAEFELLIVKSNLYKFGTNLVGAINPGPFNLTADGRLRTGVWMAEYNQDRFELDVMAKEVAQPGRVAMAKVYIWVFSPDQLVRVILSRPPAEVNAQRAEIISELRNATQHRIIVAEIRHHIDPMGRMRTDWCDLFFHAVDDRTHAIVPVDDVLKVIDAHYDFLRDYYAGYAIENVVPAHSTFVEEEFDLALAALVALVIVLFVGAISFAVLCCCLRHWTVSIPTETRRNEALIKKQIVEDLSTTENPLWIEQKLKLYEEQELTMQVFSEPELTHGGGAGGDLSALPSVAAAILDRRNSYETSQLGDNTYATIQPRSMAHLLAGGGGGGAGGLTGAGLSLTAGGNAAEVADYATLRNGSRAPSLYEFTGSTFQAPISSRSRADGDSNYVAELI